MSSFQSLCDLPSDHYAVLCSVAFAKPAASKSNFRQHRLRDMDMDAFKTDLIKSSLLNNLDTSDPNNLADLYNSELRQLLDKHAPEESRSITLRTHAPWFNAALRDSKREKRRCERASRASGLEVHRQIYRDECRKYTALLDQGKTQYYKSKIENADHGQLFRLTDGMFRVKLVPPLPSHSSVQDLTERFSAHFIDKIANLRRDLINCPATTLADGIIQSSSCSLAKFTEITSKFLRETIEKSPLKSCPSDPIPTRTLMSYLDELLPLITTLVNSSLRAGIFPNAFKEGQLLPKIKKASLDKEDLNSFRPITNLAFASSH